MCVITYGRRYWFLGFYATCHLLFYSAVLALGGGRSCKFILDGDFSLLTMKVKFFAQFFCSSEIIDFVMFNEFDWKMNERQLP